MSNYTRYPDAIRKYANASLFPISAPNGTIVEALDTHTLYSYDTGTMSWLPIASPAADLAITALMGDVTATGPGAVPATISNHAVTNAKLAQAPAMTLKGNNTAGTADEKDLTVSQVNTMLGNFGGTVTSVALTTPGVLYSVSGSPITTSGTLALSLIAQAANTVLAGPTSGGSANPSFRLLTASDIPFPVSGFTQGSVIFANVSGNLAQDNSKFFWDDTNFRLGIGTATPSTSLNIQSITEQLRLAYDATHTADFVVSSVGALTLSTTGSRADVIILPSNSSGDDAGSYFTAMAGQGGAGSGTAGANGGIASLIGGTAGVGSASGGVGGAAVIQGGAATSFTTGGVGGSVMINAANASGDNTVDQAGGFISLTGGNSVGAADASTLSITGGIGGPGTGTISGRGGSLLFVGGAGGAGAVSSQRGGNATFRSGTGGGGVTAGNGGTTTMQGGTGGVGSSTPGSGGASIVQGGTAAAQAGAAAGQARLLGGIASSTGTGGDGANIQITASNANGDATVNRVGGGVVVVAGNSIGPTPQVGGGMSLTAGIGSNGTATSGAGGAINVIAGVGGAGAGAGGDGGGVQVIGGLAGVGGTSGGTGGIATLQSGAGGAFAGSAGGAVNVNGGAGSATGSGGAGGAANIRGGAASGDNTVNRVGGAIALTAGNSKGSSAGANININAGVGGTGTGTAGASGGNITSIAGTGGIGSATSGAGGSISPSGGVGGAGVVGGVGGAAGMSAGTGGAGSSTNGNGGSLTLSAGVSGAGAGTAGVGGVILFRTATATSLSEVGRFDNAGNFGVGNSSPTYKIDLLGGNLGVGTAGNGVRVKEGSNAKQGVVTLSGGTATVSNTSVTANSRIFLTVQSLGTIAVPTSIAVTARSAGVSFTITSLQVTDTSVVAYEIFEPY